MLLEKQKIWYHKHNNELWRNLILRDLAVILWDMPEIQAPSATIITSAQRVQYSLPLKLAYNKHDRVTNTDCHCQIVRDFLIDTGAGRTSIPDSLSPVVVLDDSGRSLSISGTVTSPLTNITLKLGQREHQLDAAVHTGRLQCILGMDVLQYYTVVMHGDDSCTIVQFKDVPLHGDECSPMVIE